MEPTFFATAADFRRWLAKHHRTATELLVGYHKVATGKPSMTWPESVDEALCFGWIDGVRRSRGDDAYTIRFTPRRKGSIWSKVNVANAERLIAEGRMRPAGLAAFEAREAAKTGIYSFERDAPARFSAAETKAFKSNAKAWAFWQTQPPGYRKAATHLVVGAKKPETRARRFARVVDDAAKGLRIKELRR